MRLVRYADDFLVVVAGARGDAEALWDEASTVLAPVGLRLSSAKTRVVTLTRGLTSSAGESSADPGAVEPARRRCTHIRPRRH